MMMDNQSSTGFVSKSKKYKNVFWTVRLARAPSKTHLLLLTLLVFSMILSNCATSAYYSTSDSHLTSEMLEDYSDSLVKLLNNISKKRSCIRRGSICDHKPYDCCNNSVCRCNLWGTECRCKRKGLLQRWGKK